MGKERTLDEERAELLLDRLAEPLPAEFLGSRALPKQLQRLCDKSGLLRGAPIRDILKNPQTEVSLVKKVKDYAKQLSEHANSKAEHDTANAIYYAAIANALVFHDVQITKFSYKDLNHSFVVFAGKKWIPAFIINLFKKASQRREGKERSHKG